MTSPIKLENHLNRQQSQHGSMGKNLHLSEVITTAAATNNQHYNGLGQHRHGVMVDPVEMTKLLSNITTSHPPTSTKVSSTSSNMDYSSRLNHFSWEEIEGRYLPVIFRNENGYLQRYTSKMFVENTLFQSESWQRHAILARSLRPLISFPYTENELKLFRLIVEWHLAGFHFKTILPSDCLIRFEDLLDFYGALRKLRDKAPSTSYNRPLPAPPIPPPMAMPPPPKQRISSSTSVASNGLAQSFELPTMGDNPPLKSHVHHRLPPSNKAYPVPPLHPAVPSVTPSNYLLPQTADVRPPFPSPSSSQSFTFNSVPSSKSSMPVLPPSSAQWNDGLAKLQDKRRPSLPRPMMPMNAPQHPTPVAPAAPPLPPPVPSASALDPVTRDKTPLSAAKLPTSSIDPVHPSRETKEFGWVQINNVFVPYVVKLKLRENDLEKCSTRQPPPQLQREFYVPYEILIKCHIFSDQEFAFKKFLIKATQHDFDVFNSLISNINIFDEKVPEKTLLVNLYHVMIGLPRVLYVKLLTTKQPRAQVNKYHADVLTHKGGTLLMPENRLVPYIVQNNRFYVPLLYAYQSVPHVLSQAKRGARAPRQYEIDYLNLLFLYFSIDGPPLTSDTLLVDAFSIKCSNYQAPIHFRTLNEHQQYERNLLAATLVRLTQNANKVPMARPPMSNAKVPIGSISQKSNKSVPSNVVVNPMIHHPSFYGLPPSTKPTPTPPVPPSKSVVVNPLLLPTPNASEPKPKTPTVTHNPIKTIIYDQRSLNAIVKSADLPGKEWKISIRHIFERFAFQIDYSKFIQWCLTNSLLPLIKLDEEERHLLVHPEKDDDYYVYQRHLERCISLLHDLRRGTISMTLLPTSNSEHSSTTTMIKSPPSGKSNSNECPSVETDRVSGAKKRKATVPTTRHVPLVPETSEVSSTTTNIQESNTTVPVQETSCQSPEVPLSEQSSLVISHETEKSPVIASEPTEEKKEGTAPETNENDGMPVVATVEEERPMDESRSSDMETSLIIVESNEGDDVKIQLDDTLPSCSSGYESAPALNNIDTNVPNHPSSDDEDGVDEEDEDADSRTRSRAPSSSCYSEHSLTLGSSTNPSNANDDDEDKRSSSSITTSMNGQSTARSREKNGKYRPRSRSPSIPSAKKKRTSEPSSSATTITSDQIEQHLRTLLMPAMEQRRTRTRPIKTPTRLVEEISTQYAIKAAAAAEAEYNYHHHQNNGTTNHHTFEMLTSSPTSSTNESASNGNQSQDSVTQQSCTYNVTISNKPNKLGLTIKKVVQR